MLRYGAFSPDVLERLAWMSAVLGPLLAAAVRRHGPVDVTAILAQMVQMGDEAHNRNRTGTLMLLRDLLPSMVESGFASGDVARAAAFIGGNDHFFLNLAMPACKLALDAARDIPGATMVVAMARNGTDFGIQVSGTADEWFTAPALTPQGLFLGGYGPDDASPDIGDSAITETAGLGGFAMAAAPAIAGAGRRDGCRRARHDTAHVRDHAGRASATTGCPRWSSAARPPGLTSRWSHEPGSCRRSTPAWPAR